jgi:hypothetical protein
VANTPTRQQLHLRDSLANSSNFQAWLGVDGDADPAASAEAKIFFQQDAGPTRPCAIILDEADDRWRLRATSMDSSRDDGTLTVMFEWEPTPGDDDGDTYVGEWPTIQTICQDLMDQRNTAGRLRIDDIERIAAPFPLPHNQESGDSHTNTPWFCSVRITWS